LVGYLVEGFIFVVIRGVEELFAAPRIVEAPSIIDPTRITDTPNIASARCRTSRLRAVGAPTAAVPARAVPKR